jgi:hypothetical protein
MSILLNTAYTWHYNMSTKKKIGLLKIEETKYERAA